MPVKPLPEKPDLEHLKHQARDLLRLHAARDLAAAQRFREFHPRLRGSSDAGIFAAALKLSDAQLTIARERGFESWPRLRAHVFHPSPSSDGKRPHHERIEDPALRRAVQFLDAGDAEGLRRYLSEHPGLAKRHALFEGGNYFRTPTLLEFIAENPVRNGVLPANIVEVAKVILNAGVEQAALDETLMLVATGSVARERHVQKPLIDLLCDHGAAPAPAARAAAVLGEPASVEALLRRGAPLDLPLAAALNRLEEFCVLLPGSTPLERHLALTISADYGHAEIVRRLLDAGEDPDRYNPPGGHSHCTPLHQAALGGHEEVARLLVERGARLDMKDAMWQGTPAGWAEHAGRFELGAWLRKQENAAAQE